MILKGNNLGERHHDFNSKVSEAVAKQTNFEELKSLPEECDLDKLFKIDIASKYKNIDYILEVLKSGDVFYISRALKCLWMYSDEYSQFINPDYLEANIFPNMSKKMKSKMITAISMYMRNVDRAIDFYKYCLDARLKDYAIKFLLFTPDNFKLNLIKSKHISSFLDIKVLKQFIGDSFELALAYLQMHNYSSSTIQDLSFLYTVSEEKYLNILEHIQNSATQPQFSRRFGIRISKRILKKHKQRVLNNPILYVNILQKAMLVKHLTIKDVETLSPRLLPDYVGEYWCLNFYKTYKFILEKIPANKLHGFMKQLYVSKYNAEEFEMKMDFYWLNYYEMLNIDEREAWALKHIERDEELPGIKNYIWYKFVNFHKAFPGIKRYIFLTPDKDERSQIVNVLPETTRNQNDTYEILNYYYGRHVNESEDHKESFINNIIEFNDIYSFNNECWTTFDKLLYSLDVYTTASYVRSDYKFMSMIYHILHDMDIPEGLKEFVDNLSSFYEFDPIIAKLTDERKAIVANYLISKCVKEMESLLSHPDYIKESENKDDSGNSIIYQIQNVISQLWSIIRSFNRPDEDCPAVVVQFMESNMDIFGDHERYKAKIEIKREGDFIRWLKKDIEMAMNGISEIRCNTYRWNFRLCLLFRRLKVYFQNDVAKKYLDYFMEYLSDLPEGRREYRNIKMAVVGLFYLADQESIISFLEKYVPTSPKIDHKNIDNRVLQVQKAICRLSYHPRPPLPFSIIQKYITGDYAHFCTPMIYSYIASLPSSAKFIDGLLDAPLSIQKHGLRLAFRSYDADTLNPIIKSAWIKTKNVSLRMILFETLFNRILNENHEVQVKLYEVLKLYTSDLNHDDHASVYLLLVSDEFPDTLKGDFIETAWITVSKLSDKSLDIQRRISIICHMEKYLHLVQRDFLRLQIIDDQVKDMLCEKNINQHCDTYQLQQLIDAKWQLTAKYIVCFNDESEQQKSVQLMQTIMTESLKSWNLVKKTTYTLRKFVDEFIRIIKDKDPKTIKSCETIIPIYQCILDTLKSSLKKEEMYLLNWELQLILISRQIISKLTKGKDSKTEVPTNWTEIADAYGESVAEMVVRSIKNNEFYCCFYESIADIINNVGCTMCNILDKNDNDCIYNVCENLIKTKMIETHLLAVLMLPSDPKCFWKNRHSAIITEIKNQSLSQQVRSALYQKYVLADYVVRDYMM